MATISSSVNGNVLGTIYRELKGLTQQQVADYLGFKSTARISKWEKGVQYPHLVNFIQLLKLYGANANEIYNITS
ncbi:MAG: hypothetical protein BGO70_01025 [Bacteroidetes bacterium 43-93]|uniref:helix-turn-helix domain-containing protein n=1 Tax=uncultured Dysgonomonas sp. TaxID=206096 RepID=UPI00092AB26C|nr:helix-turn-helix transcriptional regulator [uncultured Dysgonomonas sp.]OJW96294.1 MAG: hypothetical protein BGO70_01025 [Bacteroidetes bacterium 43-93]